MFLNIGRVYYFVLVKVGGIGLIKLSFVIEFSKYFEFENGEDNFFIFFIWKGEKFQLINDLIDLMDKFFLEIREFLSNKN